MKTDKKRGMQTIALSNPPVLAGWATIVGPKEGESPWQNYYDKILSDYMFEEDTFEKAESKILRETIKLVVNKNNLQLDDIEVFLSGDLLNQTVSSNYAARELEIPYLGLYGACSTMAESLVLASMLVDGGFYNKVIAAACSHHYSAERQFRFPVEQGVQSNPTNQWTATAAGALIVENTGIGPYITNLTVGKVVDMGQADIADMGSAMAPAAVATIKQHFADLNIPSDYYDLVITGDLGSFGMAIAEQLFIKEGIVPQPNYTDCGAIFFDKKQKVNAGASGCGCAAAMLCGPLLNMMKIGKINKLLLVATGALMSPITSFQGESIPAIAHAVAIEN